MGDLVKLFGVDKRAEIEGVWCEDVGDGIRVKIARIGNPEYQKDFQKIAKPHRRALRRGTLNDETAEKLLIRAMARSILLDWEGIEEDGVTVEYSEENAIRLLKEYRDFRDIISDMANEIEAFRVQGKEEGEKN